MIVGDLDNGHVGATLAAERSSITGRGAIARDKVRAGNPAKPLRIGVKKAAERRPVHLAAHRAVTMVDQLDAPGQLVFHLSTKTCTPNHRDIPAGVGLDMLGRTLATSEKLEAENAGHDEHNASDAREG